MTKQWISLETTLIVAALLLLALLGLYAGGQAISHGFPDIGSGGSTRRGTTAVKAAGGPEASFIGDEHAAIYREAINGAADSASWASGADEKAPGVVDFATLDHTAQYRAALAGSSPTVLASAPRANVIGDEHTAQYRAALAANAGSVTWTNTSRAETVAAPGNDFAALDHTKQYRLALSGVVSPSTNHNR